MKLGAAKQGAQNRNLTQAGETLDGFGIVVFDQAGDDEALPVVELHGGVGPTHGEGWQHRGDAADRCEGRAGLRKLRHFRHHFQVDPGTVEHGRREFDADTELFFLQGNSGPARVVVLRHWNENFAAREETGRLTRNGHDVGFRQYPHQTIVFLSVDLQRHAADSQGLKQAAPVAQKARQQRVVVAAAAACAVEPDTGAELVEQRLADFSDFYFQHDLLRRHDAQHVDHFLAVTIGHGQADDFVKLDGVTDFAGQHNGVFCTLDLDAGFFRHQFGEFVLQRVGVDGDDDVFHHTAPVCTLQDHVHRARFFAEKK